MAPILWHAALADCGFNHAALHPADPHQMPQSTQRTQAPKGIIRLGPGSQTLAR